MPLPNPTVENLVTFLQFSKKSNIIVEDKDDEIIFQRLLDCLGIFNVGLFGAGSKETLLRLYDKLSVLEHNGDFRHAPVAFIADKDMWLFRGIPTQYKDIIWTEGYSIENDLYSSAKLRDRIRNKTEYDQVLDSISMWFAYKVEEYLEKNLPPPEKILRSFQDEEHVYVGLHCNRIVPMGNTTLAPDLEFLPADHERVKEVRKEYNLQLRGKLLFQLLVRFLNKPTQGFREATVSYYSLYNDAITVPESDQLFARFENEVQDRLNAQKLKTATR